MIVLLRKLNLLVYRQNSETRVIQTQSSYCFNARINGEGGEKGGGGKNYLRN